MAKADIKRVNFYDTLPDSILTKRTRQTFADEQAYHEAVARLHNRSMHSWGVVYGLEVTASADKRSVAVGPGLAIDKDGQEIYLAGPTPEKVNFKNNQPPCYVVAGYDFELAKGDESADKLQTGNAPWWRKFVKAQLDTVPISSEPGRSVIVLAKVEQDGVININPSVRQSAGAVLNPNADIAARGLTLTGAATLQNGLTVSGSSAELQNGLTVKNGLTVEDGAATFRKGLTVDNALTIAADGTATFKKGLTVSGSSAELQNGLTVKNGLTVEDGAATFKKGLTVDNALTISADGTATFKKGLTVDGAAATFKKGLTVEDDATFKKVTVGGYSADDKSEFEQVIWLRDVAKDWDEKLIKYSGGQFKNATDPTKQRAGFGIHMHKSREFGIWSTGPAALFSVEGDTGNTWIKGSLKFRSRIAELISLYDPYYAIGIQPKTLYARTHYNFAWYKEGKHSDTEFEPGGPDPTDKNDKTIIGKRLMSLTDARVERKVGNSTVQMAPAGLTVEVDATFRKKVTVGGFSTDDEDEVQRVIWLLDPDKGWDDFLIKHGSSKGHFKRAGFGIHMHTSREFGIWSSGWTPLFSVEGGSGNAWVKGGLTVDGAVKLGGFSTNDTGEYEKMIWLRDKPDGQAAEKWDEKLIKYPKGHFNRAGFGIHMHKTREFGIWSTGPLALFSVEGDTGNAWVKGGLTADGAATFKKGLTVEDGAATFKKALTAENGATIKQEGWRGAKLNDNWSGETGYFKDSLGIVHLRGWVQSAYRIQLLDPKIFEFSDAAYRPAKDELHIVGIRYGPPTQSSHARRDDFGHLSIGTNGVVQLISPDLERDLVVFLDGLTFGAAG